MIFLAFLAVAASPVLPTDATTSQWISEATKAVPHDFRDPDSSQFRNVSINVASDKTNYVCGEVNTKNGYGAYVGFSPFSYNVKTKEVLNYDLDLPKSTRLLLNEFCGIAWTTATIGPDVTPKHKVHRR